MTAPPPARPVHGSADEAPADDVLAALEHALGDPAQPESTRALLREAREALALAREEAGNARQRYDALFNAVPDPVSIIDYDGIVLDLNRAGMAAYKRPREDVVGRPIHVLNPDLPPGHMAPVVESLRRGGSYVIEVTNMRADGTRFPVEVHSAALQYDGRECLVAVARDLSGRRDAELRYRELVETLDQGILVQDAGGRYLFANAAAMRIFGIGKGRFLEEEMRPDNWLVIDEHGRELSPGQWPAQRALQWGRTVESTLLGFYHRERRQLSWLSVTSVPHYPAGGDRPHQILSLYSDVTALKRDSALFDRAQALAHIGGWEWDSGRDELYLTSEAQRIIGCYPPPRYMDAFMACLRVPDRQRLRDGLARATATGNGLNLELQGMHGSGRPFWIRVIGEPLVGAAYGARLTGTLQDITERKQAEEMLRIQARTDPLTGLLNRDAVLEELDGWLQEPEPARIAVLYIDLDRFKIVNDMLGHAAGDRLLINASRRIAHVVGLEGMIARFGGDEFLVICMAQDDPGRPQRLAEGILQAFDDAFRLDGEEFSITASIGIALAPQDGLASQQLIQCADVAMYDSKRRGRNGWQAFTPELAEQQLQRLQLETHLRRAVCNDEFHLVYQPQVDMRSGRLLGAEALIRWRNSSLGEMRPDRFIEHAESTGDIVGIGRWALQEACRQLRAWLDRGLDIDRVAVNVSYRQFLSEDLILSVREALDRSGLPGRMLELEFTERVLIEDEPETLRAFEDLRSMGVSLSIDDFGEGYSALNYLRRLPIHGLKLSQLFIQGVPGNQSDVAVCQAVAGIASSLGLQLVAEGVENEDQRGFLLQLGVGIGQGFLFAPGLPPDQLLQRYRTTAE